MIIQEEYLIHELSEQAGVTVRTIRYYTDQGLLPQPIIRGKYAYYTSEYLDRLKLIRRLKEKYLPLREIYKTMTSLTGPEVRQLIEHQDEGSKAGRQYHLRSETPPKATNSALEYISNLLKEKPGYTYNFPPDFGHNQPSSLPRPRPPQFQSNIEEVDRQIDRETWQRINLAPGVELNLRKPVDPKADNNIQRLIQFARQLFRFEESGGKHEKHNP